MTSNAIKWAAPALGLAATLLLHSAAWGFVCQDLPLMQLKLQDGTDVRIFVLDKKIDSTKEWVIEEKDSPPLPLGKAVDIAKTWAKKNYTEFDEVRVGRISLHERRCGFSRGRWFYIFDFDPVDGRKMQLGTGHYVAVLMDGTVIPPNQPPPTD